MNFKNFIFVFYSLLLPAAPVFAQPGPKKELEAQKVAYITQQLALTTPEAQAFWPLYNEYQQKRDNLKEEQRKLRKSIKENFDSMSDKDVETFIDQELDIKQKELDLAKEFHKKMKAVLPMKKVALYYRAVEEFNKTLLDKVKSGPGPKGK